MIPHAELMRRFDGERSLPDGVIENTTVADWAALLTELRRHTWAVNFDDDLVAFDLFPPSEDSELLTIKVITAEGVQVNIFPYQHTSVDFDFDTSELHTQVEVDALASVIEAIGRAVNRNVAVFREGGSGLRLFEFDIATGKFRFADPDRT